MYAFVLCGVLSLIGGRQAEYVKQLESELAMVKADPSWREDAKDAWIKRLQEDNRQLKVRPPLLLVDTWRGERMPSILT